MTGPSGLHDDGTLSAECWCGRRVLRVSVFDVRQGRTGACDEACEQIGKDWLEREQAA